jgi:hypothetical protein
MSRQNWTDVNGIKVNNEVLADLQTRGFFIIMGEGGYPWVAYIPRICPSCGLSPGGVPAAAELLGLPLPRYVAASHSWSPSIVKRRGPRGCMLIASTASDVVPAVSFRTDEQ